MRALSVMALLLAISPVQAFTLNDVGACMQDKVEGHDVEYATGRANIFVSSQRSLSLQLFYNQIVEEVAMPYHVTVKGGMSGDQVGVEAVDFLFDMEPVSQEELGQLQAEAKKSPDFMELFFPEGLATEMTSEEGRKQLETLTIFYTEIFPKKERKLNRLLGVIAYKAHEMMSGADIDKRDADMRTTYFAQAIDPAKLSVVVHRKDGTGKSFDVTECFVSPAPYVAQ